MILAELIKSTYRLKPARLARDRISGGRYSEDVLCSQVKDFLSVSYFETFSVIIILGRDGHSDLYGETILVCLVFSKSNS